MQRLWGDELKIGPFILKSWKDAHQHQVMSPQPYDTNRPAWDQQYPTVYTWQPRFYIFDTRDLGKQSHTGFGDSHQWLPVCVCHDEASAAQVIAALCMSTLTDGPDLAEVRGALSDIARVLGRLGPELPPEAGHAIASADVTDPALPVVVVDYTKSGEW